MTQERRVHIAHGTRKLDDRDGHCGQDFAQPLPHIDRYHVRALLDGSGRRGRVYLANFHRKARKDG
jgi:hypothetical protein